MIATNDNQTLEAFNARAAPLPSRAELRPNDPRQVHYVLQGKGRAFELLRIGMTKILRHVPEQFAAFPTAAAPHPWCPEHTYTPVQTAVRQPQKKVARPLPSYMRVVA